MLVIFLSLKNFGSTYVKPPSKNFKKNTLYYGTIKVTAPKSTDMKYKVFGWIEGAVLKHKKKTQHVARKWDRLSRVERVVNLD